MKRLVLGTVIGLLSFASVGAAQSRAFTKCPNFVVYSEDGTYQSFKSLFGGKKVRCGNKASSIRSKGYIPVGGNTTKPDPKVIQNPELDTERVLTGIGDTDIKKVFRVSSTARVVSITATNCDVSIALLTVTDQNYKSQNVFFGGNGELKSMTVFNPGIYDLNVFDHGSRCSWTVTIQ